MSRLSPLIIFCMIGLSAQYTDRTYENSVLYDEKQPKKHYFNKIVSKFMKERNIPGASIAISHHNKFIFKRAYGLASKNQLMSPWSLFRVAGVSKMITAAGVMHLFEKKNISLDCFVFGQKGILNDYNAENFGDPNYKKITVRHLLQHSAGWDERINGDPMLWQDVGKRMGKTDPPDKHTLMNYVLKQKLSYAPGFRYAYSNFGYMVLGLVIEKVSGISYEKFIQRILFMSGIYSMKLGHTRYEDRDMYEVEYFPQHANALSLSIFSKDGFVAPPYGSFFIENMASSAGWLSTAADLVLFANALSNENNNNLPFLNRHVLKQMQQKPTSTQSMFSKTDDVWYGMGIIVQDEGKTWWHAGVLEGSSSLIVHGADGSTSAVLFNINLKNEEMIHLGKILLGKQPFWLGTIPLPHPPVPGSIISFNERYIVKLMIDSHKYKYMAETLNSMGYLLTWVDVIGFNKNNSLYFNTIWIKNENRFQWSMYYGMTSAFFKRKYQSKIAQGYRLSHIDAYVNENRIRYLAIFIKDEWASWVAYHGFSPEQHKKKFLELNKKGFSIIKQSVTEFRNNIYISAIYMYMKINNIRVRMGLTMEDFKLELNIQLSRNRIPLYVKAYSYKNQIRVSCIWMIRTVSTFRIKYDVDQTELDQYLLESSEINLPLASVTAYENNNEVNFIALWRDT